MFPEYKSHTYELIKQYKELFPEDFKKSYPFQLGGYLVVRNDNAIWGSPDQIAYYLFTKREDAEATKRTIDSDGSWTVKQFGLSELNMNDWATSQDLGE